MLFWNNDYSRVLAGHMRPVTSAVRPASAQCWWLCHLSPNGLVESVTQSGTVHRKYIGLPRRINRNEYYLALLYIVRQVTIPYSALQFRRNSPVFWCFEIPRVPGHKVACRACMRIPIYSGLYTPGTAVINRNIRLPMWILSIAISIIDLNVHRWSTSKLM